MKIQEGIVTALITFIVCPIIQVKSVGSLTGNECESKHCKGDTCKNGTCSDGCEAGYSEPSCLYKCSKGCISGRCSDNVSGIGVCLEGCNPGYWGETCNNPCPSHCKTCTRETGKYCTSCHEFQTGTLCEGDCRASCPTSGCYINSTCKTDLIACNNGKFGQSCTLGCSTNCLYNTCNRTSGLCLHGCKSGYFGNECGLICNSNCKNSKCDIYGNCTDDCAIGYFGNDCEKECNRNCRRLVCGRYTGECTNGCSNGYYRLHCDKMCFPGCSECHRKTGECLEVLKSSTPAGSNSTQSPLNRNNTGYFILAAVGSLFLLGIITGIFIKRKWGILRRHSGNILTSTRKLPHPPVELNYYGYEVINEGEINENNEHVLTADTAGVIPPCLDIEDRTNSYCPQRLFDTVEESNIVLNESDGVFRQMHQNTSQRNLATEIVFDQVFYRKCTNSEDPPIQKSSNKYLFPVACHRDLHSV